MLVQYKTSEYEQLYTLTEVEEIINYNSGKAMQKRKAEKMYFAKQRFSGLVMLTIGIITPFLFDGDATVSLIAVPMGIGLIMTKYKVMVFER